jgi:hypothetical protein
MNLKRRNRKRQLVEQDVIEGASDREIEQMVRNARRNRDIRWDVTPAQLSIRM